MTLIGRNKLEFIGDKNKIIAIFQLLIGIVFIHMNFWELKRDFVSLH